MIIKKAIILLASMFLFSCNNTNTKQTKEENITDKASIELLDGYYIKNSLIFETNTKHLIIKNQNEFDKYFAAAKTMNNIISKTNFDKFNIAAILTKVSFTKSNITNVSIEKKQDNILIVDYKILKETEKSYSSSDLILFKINKKVNKIIFTEGENNFTVE